MTARTNRETLRGCHLLRRRCLLRPGRVLVAPVLCRSSAIALAWIVMPPAFAVLGTMVIGGAMMIIKQSCQVSPQCATWSSLLLLSAAALSPLSLPASSCFAALSSLAALMLGTPVLYASRTISTPCYLDGFHAAACFVRVPSHSHLFAPLLCPRCRHRSGSTIDSSSATVRHKPHLLLVFPLPFFAKILPSVVVPQSYSSTT